MTIAEANQQIAVLKISHERAMGIVARMQSDLKDYALRPNASEKYIEIRNEIIASLSDYIAEVSETIDVLVAACADQYQTGFAAGRRLEVKLNERKYAMNAEDLRVASIGDTRRKWADHY